MGEGSKYYFFHSSQQPILEPPAKLTNPRTHNVIQGLKGCFLHRAGPRQPVNNGMGCRIRSKLLIPGELLGGASGLAWAKEVELQSHHPKSWLCTGKQARFFLEPKDDFSHFLSLICRQNKLVGWLVFFCFLFFNKLSSNEKEVLCLAAPQSSQSLCGGNRCLLAEKGLSVLEIRSQQVAGAQPPGCTSISCCS